MTADLEKLAQARRNFLTSIEKESAIPEILRQAQEILGLKDLAIYALKEDKQKLTRACQGSKHFVLPNVPVEVNRDSLPGRAAFSVETLVESYGAFQRLDSNGYDPESRVRVAIPILTPGQTIGVILAEQSGMTIEDWKVQALESVALDLGIFVQNLKSVRNLRQRIHVDEATGLYTPARFLELLEVELKRARRNDSPLGILHLDITIDPQFLDGPLENAMQTILRETAQLLKGACRATDVLGKSTGNGIIVALGAVDIEKSLLVAEKLYQLILNAPLNPPVSISIGVVSYPFHGHEKEELLFMAQQACRLARHSAGNPIFTIGNDRMKTIALRAFPGLLTHDFHIGPEAANEFAAYLEEMSADPLFSPLVKEIVESLACAIDAKDNYTKNHSEEATLYAEALGVALGLPAKELELAKMAAKLHDLGKIGIPEQILCKPGPLNEEEWWIIKEHPTIGTKIIAPIKSLAELVPIVHCHHERWNGSGYPMGLRETEIPEGARLIAVIDSFHAIISKRPYKDAMPVDFALSELVRQ